MADTNQHETLEMWAKYVIERWERRISDLNVISTKELLNSFKHQVIRDSGGNLQKIIFTYAYYGSFADLGVGKGVKAGLKSNRKKKKWYTKVFFGQVNKLAKIMAEKYGQQAAISIVENITVNII
ncbi:MAG: hypothetical protein LBF04_03890 [Prevotellaceae bacterium]|jgi:hypothetical protein|nr:hypothetical protein [Prevotellaceae bacterium]